MASSSALPYKDIELVRYRAGKPQSNDDPVAHSQKSLSLDSEDDANTLIDSTASVNEVYQTPATKVLEFHRPVFRSDITIHNVTGGIDIPIYHAATTEWNFYKPDVTLYAGSRAAGPILAVSNFRWSMNAKMGIGNPENETEVVWEELRNTSPFYGHCKYQFEFTEPGRSKSNRRHLMWLRTTAAEFGNNTWSGWFSRRHYKLIDLETGELMGVFLANNVDSLTKKGELRMFTHVSKELEMVIVLTMASISEKTTRRVRRQHSHGGGS